MSEELLEIVRKNLNHIHDYANHYEFVIIEFSLSFVDKVWLSDMHCASYCFGLFDMN